MDEYKLYEAEYKFMDIIWKHEPVNSTELTKLCFQLLGWKKSTTYTMIKKLSERGILNSQHATVTALIRREQVQKYESEILMEKAFNNNLPAFLAAFLKDRKISKQEAEDIKKMIEEASK